MNPKEELYWNEGKTKEDMQKDDVGFTWRMRAIEKEVNEMIDKKEQTFRHKLSKCKTHKEKQGCYMQYINELERTAEAVF